MQFAEMSRGVPNEKYNKHGNIPFFIPNIIGALHSFFYCLFEPILHVAKGGGESMTYSPIIFIILLCWTPKSCDNLYLRFS